MAWSDRPHPQENTCSKIQLPKSMSSTLEEALLWFNSSQQISPTELLVQSPTVGWGRESEG